MTARRAIVTGGSSGIGRATAILLAERGYDLGITYAGNPAGAEKTADAIQALGRRAVVEQMKLEDHASIATAVTSLSDELGGLDAFVNNAGVLGLQTFLDMDLALWRRVVEGNLTGAFVAGQAAARRMVADGARAGRIVNVSSVHEAIPMLEGAAYCASKAGIGMLTKCMALDLAPHGITVNAVAPGETATAMSGAFEDEPVEARRRPDIPVGRPGRPREMAFAIAALLDPEASYTTGTTVFVDGGMMLTAAVPNQRTIMAALKA